jgi:hypothetical protein
MTPAALAASPSATAEVRIRLRDAAAAQRAYRALSADDAGHAALAVDGRDLVVVASSASALGLLRTLDDLLGCLRAAEPEL